MPRVRGIVRALLAFITLLGTVVRTRSDAGRLEARTDRTQRQAFGLVMARGRQSASLARIRLQRASRLLRILVAN